MKLQPHPATHLAPYLRFRTLESGAQRWQMRLYHSDTPQWVDLQVAAQESAERVFYAYDADPEAWEGRVSRRKAARVSITLMMESCLGAKSLSSLREASVRSAVRGLVDHCGDLPAGQITTDTIRGWVAARRASGCVENTVASDLRAVASIYSWGIEEGVLAENPCRRIRTKEGPALDRKIITPQQALKLFDADTAEAHRAMRDQLGGYIQVAMIRREDVRYARAWLLTSFWLAARPDEIARLRGDAKALDVRGDRAWVQVVQTKVGGTVRRPVPLTDLGLMIPEITLWLAAPDRYAHMDRMTRWLRVEGLRMLGHELNRADLRSSGITALCRHHKADDVARWTGTSVKQVSATYRRPLQEQEPKLASLLA